MTVLVPVGVVNVVISKKVSEWSAMIKWCQGLLMLSVCGCSYQTNCPVPLPDKSFTMRMVFFLFHINIKTSRVKVDTELKF